MSSSSEDLDKVGVDLGEGKDKTYGVTNIGFIVDEETPEPEKKTEGGLQPQFTYPDNTPNPTLASRADLEDGKSIGSSSGEPARDQWSNQMEFLLSCIAMSVGLGNIWRFPFTAYENGGGAFLIPYLIVLFFIGKPVYYLELALGQFSSYGQVKAWRLAPFFKGLGYAQMLACTCTFSYYTFLMALTVFYFFSSFAKKLPWSECNDDWLEDTLYECGDNNTVKFNGSQISMSIPELFFTRHVLNEKENVNDGIGTPDLRLVGCLAFVWTAICLVIIKGVKSSGKVSYFTALFPYVVLITLLIRGCTLEGAWKGIKYFIEPQWDKIYEVKVWYEAVKQCFFSLNTGFGTILMFSSYNPFKHNIYRDAWIISLADCGTSLLAGFTIFSILGSLATALGVEVEDVAAGGPGLAFVSYPQALSQFTPADWAPQLFAVIFFLMLFTLGIGSATALVGSVITIICDQFQRFPRWQVTIATCVCAFLVTLMYATPGGLFMLTLVDEFGANFVVYIIVIVETFAISWIYGLRNICQDIEFMIDVKVSIYWKICWGGVVPGGLSAIFIYIMATQDKLTHNNQEYPTIGYVCGWLLAVFIILVIPISGFHTMHSIKEGSIIEKFKKSLKPKAKFGPKNKNDKKEWRAFKAEALRQRIEHMKAKLAELLKL